MTTTPDHTALQTLKDRAQALKLYGVLAHWDELSEAAWPWLQQLLDWEERERNQRGLQRRLSTARIGRFTPLAEFDWSWPTQCDQQAVCALMSLSFIHDASNIILVGPNGIGKSTIAQNITHHAVLQGYSAIFVNAAQMLSDLAAQDGDNALRRRLKYYAQPQLLAVDEIGYLSYGTRHADLLFEVVNRRYQQKPTIVTTNRPFAEWNEVFPNAACVVSIIDRLVHHSEILVLEGDSYRMKEAQERAQRKKKHTASARRKTAKPETATTP